jgi:hypothetical protein
MLGGLLGGAGTIAALPMVGGPQGFQSPQQVQANYQPAMTMSQAAAGGGAPSAADYLAAKGLGQAQQAASARAASTRGGFGLAGAQKGAMDTGATMAQNAVNENAARRATEQATARGQFNQLTGQENAAEQAARAAQQGQANKTLQGLTSGLSSLGGLAMMSDERAKEVTDDSGAAPDKYQDEPTTPGNVLKNTHPLEAAKGFVNEHNQIFKENVDALRQMPGDVADLGKAVGHLAAVKAAPAVDEAARRARGGIASALGTTRPAQGFEFPEAPPPWQGPPAPEPSRDTSGAVSFSAKREAPSMSQATQAPPHNSYAQPGSPSNPVDVDQWQPASGGAVDRMPPLAKPQWGGSYEGAVPNIPHNTQKVRQPEDVETGRPPLAMAGPKMKPNPRPTPPPAPVALAPGMLETGPKPKPNPRPRPPSMAVASGAEPPPERPVLGGPPTGGEASALAFLDHLQPHTFGWKDQSVAPNPESAKSKDNIGVFAQDVERAPGGHNVVREDERGLKHLDMKALTAALAAGAGAAKKRQDEHEARLAALEQAMRGARA